MGIVAHTEAGKIRGTCFGADFLMEKFDFNAPAERLKKTMSCLCGSVQRGVLPVARSSRSPDPEEKLTTGRQHASRADVRTCVELEVR